MTKFLGMVAGIALATLAEGFTLMTLWGWFVAPVFGLPLLLWSQAIGISLTAKMFTGVMGVATEQNALFTAAGGKRDHGEAIARAIVLPLVMLGLGWVYRLFL